MEMQAQNTNWFDRANDAIRNAEGSIVNILSAIAPWGAPLAPASMAYGEMIGPLGFSKPVAVILAIVIEILGLATVSTTISFWQHNREHKGSEQMPVALAGGMFGCYLAIILTVNVLMELPNEWIGFPIIARALLTLLAVPAAVTLVIRVMYTDLVRRLARERETQIIREQEERQREQEREEKQRNDRLEQLRLEQERADRLRSDQDRLTIELARIESEERIENRRLELEERARKREERAERRAEKIAAAQIESVLAQAESVMAQVGTTVAQPVTATDDTIPQADTGESDMTQVGTTVAQPGTYNDFTVAQMARNGKGPMSAKDIMTQFGVTRRTAYRWLAQFEDTNRAIVAQGEN